MKKFDINRIIMFLMLLLALLAFSVNKFIMGGIFLILAYSIYRNGGAGSYKDKTLYEKEADAENLTIEDMYEAFKDMETPIGKCWIGKHKAFKDEDVIIWGPNGFKDCVVLGKVKDKAYMRNALNMDNFSCSEDDKWRFDVVIDTTQLEITPKRYSIFAANKLMSVILLEDIKNLVEELNKGNNRIPAVLDSFNMYHMNSYDCTLYDIEDNVVLKADTDDGQVVVVMTDVDDNEMVRIERTEDKNTFNIIVDDNQFGTIVKERSKNDRYTLATEAGVFVANNFQNVAMAKLSTNYTITMDGEPKAYTGASAQIIFEGIGKTNNMVVCSMDDDYLVLYAAFQAFLINMYKFLR